MQETWYQDVNTKKFLLALIFTLLILAKKKSYKSWGVTATQGANL
jgi:hypothetical protein